MRNDRQDRYADILDVSSPGLKPLVSFSMSLPRSFTQALFSYKNVHGYCQK